MLYNYKLKHVRFSLHIFHLILFLLLHICFLLHNLTHSSFFFFFSIFWNVFTGKVQLKANQSVKPKKQTPQQKKQKMNLLGGILERKANFQKSQKDHRSKAAALVFKDSPEAAISSETDSGSSNKKSENVVSDSICLNTSNNVGFDVAVPPGLYYCKEGSFLKQVKDVSHVLPNPAKQQVPAQLTAYYLRNEEVVIKIKYWDIYVGNCINLHPGYIRFFWKVWLSCRC